MLGLGSFDGFLDASSHLYKRVCPSVRPSVGRSVRPSVGPLRLCKNRDFRLFLATMRSFTESTERKTCFESLHYYSCRFIFLFDHLSVRPSVRLSARPYVVRPSVR